jgi:exodeoxyribonuclease VIII
VSAGTLTIGERSFTVPGVLDALPIEEYHAGPGLSNSGLSDLRKSPAHFYARHLHPQRRRAPETAAQLAGNLLHCAVLEPEEFERRYIVGPAWNKNTTKWKDWKAEQVAAGLKVIDGDDYDLCQRQADSVRALPEVAELLAAGKAEQSAYWIDPQTGVLCKCRPDFVADLNRNAVALLDCKTYSDASSDGFARQVARMGYHFQDAWYSDGFQAASGRSVEAFVFVAVEGLPPYAAHAMMIVDDKARELARLENRRQLEVFAQCMASNAWPGYGTAIEPIKLPAWLFSFTPTNEE